jgi:hypothetical protein
MVQAMARLQVRVIRDRRLVQELLDQDLKVARCHYTEESLRGASQTETDLRLSESMLALLTDLIMVPRFQLKLLSSLAS